MTYINILSLLCTQDTARPARGSLGTESNIRIFVHRLAGLACVICFGSFCWIAPVFYFRVIYMSMN